MSNIRRFKDRIISQKERKCLGHVSHRVGILSHHILHHRSQCSTITESKNFSLDKLSVRFKIYLDGRKMANSGLISQASFAFSFKIFCSVRASVKLESKYLFKSSQICCFNKKSRNPFQGLTTNLSTCSSPTARSPRSPAPSRLPKDRATHTVVQSHWPPTAK